VFDTRQFCLASCAIFSNVASLERDELGLSSSAFRDHDAKVLIKGKEQKEAKVVAPELPLIR